MASKRAASKAKARTRAKDLGQRDAKKVRARTVSIVGAGRLGTALGLALAACGYTIEALVTKRKAHAARMSRLFQPQPLALSSAELNRLPPSDILLIATPDDLIKEAAGRIQSEMRAMTPIRTATKTTARTALHTSGALSSDELKSLREVGFHVGSMHPLVAVSEPRTGAESLRRAFFCIEGEPLAQSVARRIVRSLDACAFSINSQKKALYHAAAVTASGHVVALFDIALEMLTNCGLSERDARAILMPLLQSTVDNLSEQTPSRALTGTFARADVSTVRRHLRALEKEALSDAQAAYRLLGLRSIQLAMQNKVDTSLLKQIEKALGKSESKQG